jgi:hypothetical protein
MRNIPNNKTLPLRLLGVILVLLMMTTVASAEPVAPVKEMSFIEMMKAKAEVVKQKAEAIYREYYSRFFGNENKVAETSTESRLPASEPVVATPTVDAQKLAELPSFKTPGVEQQTAQIKTVRENIAQKNTYEKKAGRAADATLHKSKSGVPVFELFEKTGKSVKAVKSIPVLDIGVEDEISKSDFQFELPKIFSVEFQKITELKTPAVIKQSELEPFYKMKFDLAQKSPKIEDILLALPKDITPEKINQMQLVIDQDQPMVLKPYTEITLNELNLLKGLLYSEYQDRCHLAAGFFRELRDLKGTEKDLRDYHYSTCLYKMGFYTESVPMLTTFVERNSAETKPAVDLILSDVKREFVPVISEGLAKVKPENVPEKKENEFNYYIALGKSIKGDQKSALAYAIKVRPDSKKYPEAQYLAGVSEYLLGDVKSSLDRQEKLLVEIDKRGITGPLKSLIKMNIGRTAYRNKQYAKAIDSYKFVGRENSMWIESLTEQGWMQILGGDAAGAVGNMYSIQVPQFKDIYKPESYVVRAIGYMNICQFGDAKKTLDHLSKIYSPWIASIKTELAKQQFNYAFYQNVVDGLRTENNKTTLPPPILREISRHKDFLNIQEAINNKVDEGVQFGFIHGVIQKDLATAKAKMNAARNRANTLEQQIKTASSAKDTLKFVSQWRAEKNQELDTVDYYNFEIDTINASLGGYKDYEAYAKKNLEEQKTELKSTAGKTMKARLLAMQKRLQKLMENNEFLTYEIFSGSGENIRFVSAGGQTKGTKSTRETASKSNESGKVFLWDFDGEFWADEVGNYKSSLKDNCPSANNLTQKVQ